MTKRKAKKEKARRNSKPRKRVAFTAPKTAAAKAIIARNASESPLLRLPFEIRNRIWKEVLGNNLVHIQYSYDDQSVGYETNEEMHRYENSCWTWISKKTYGSAWRHLICADDGPEDRPDKKKVGYRCFDASQKVTSWVRPHENCHSFYRLNGPSRPLDSGWEHATMRLTVLRASRKLYVEANQIVWTTNTFSFTDSITLKRFMMTRNIHQRRLIRSLRLEMEWDCDEVDSAWNGALSKDLIKSLSGLRSLRLQVETDLDRENYRLVRKYFLQTTRHCEGLRRLSTLPLDKVEVVVKLPTYRIENDVNDLLPKSAREEIARDVEKMLLDSKAMEVHQEA
ncbi:MAG: hypothetical protein Q9210_003519 [Variospora velana]